MIKLVRTLSKRLKEFHKEKGTIMMVCVGVIVMERMYKKFMPFAKYNYERKPGRSEEWLKMTESSWLYVLQNDIKILM